MQDNWYRFHYDFDDLSWSLVRLYNAWRSWCMFVCMGESKQTLSHKLRYYRRSYAEEQRRKKATR